MNAAIITRRGSGGSGFGGLQLISSTFISGNSDGQINIPDNGHFYIFGNIYENSSLYFIEIKNYAILSAVRYFEGSINSADISENFSMSGAVLTDAYRSSSFRYDRLFRALSVKSLPTLQNPATNAEIKSGYQAIDQEGNVIKGTLTVPTEVKVTATTVNLGTFTNEVADGNTGISVSDLQNPKIGKNVFVTLSSLTNFTRTKITEAKVTAEYSIVHNYVYARFWPSVSSAFLELRDVQVTVYKVYT